MANVIKHKRGSGSDPVASDLVVGEVAIRTDVGKLFTKMDNGSVAEIAGGGSDIAINTLSSSSGTGGGSATFNGSAFRFTLSAPPSVSAQQLLVSINGVIQKPVAGTGQPSEGFSVDGTDIILGAAPATGSDFFILTFKSLGVSEPADNTVTSAKIVDGAIVNADINASAAIAGSKISPDFGSQNIITAGNLTIQSQFPKIELIDTNNNDDFEIRNANGLFVIRDATDNVDRLSINSSGFTSITGNFFVSNDFTLNGDLTIDTNTLHVDSSNNRVGIGTTSPSVKTQISVSNTTAYSASTVDANQFQLSVTNTGANGVAGILLATEPSSGNGGHCGIRALSTGSGNSALTFSTRGGSTQAERMRIDSSGRLLIGTTTGDPYGNRMLTVKSSSSSTAIELRSATNGDGRIIFTDNTTSGDPGSFKCQIKYLQSSDDFIITSNGDNERFRIDSSGNVGIGTTSPTDKLHVVGDVEFELGTELIDVMTTGSGTKYPIRLLNADASAGNKVGIEFGAANNVVCSRIAGIAESDFTSTANRDGGITFESRLNGTLSEAMRIDSSGRLLIGQTSTLGSASSGGKLHVAASISGGGQGVIVATDTSSNDFGCGLIVLKNTTTTSSSQRFIQFYANTDGQPMGGIVGNGSEKAQFIQLSDERWKKNIKPLSGILEKVNKLDVVSFDWKHVNESVEAGFIAQNVQKIFPEYVSENIANEGEEARLGTTGGMAGGYIAILTAAIQELSAKVEALEAK